MRRFLAFISLPFLAFACSNSELTASDLIPWVEDDENGLHKELQVSAYEFEAQYKPIDYIVAMEARTDEISELDYQSTKTELEGLEYFDLSIGGLYENANALNANISSDEEYFSRLDYYLTYARNDIFLAQDSDTLMPVIYHFERNYGISSKNKILLGFETEPTNLNDMTLVMDDQVLGIGRVKFTFSKEDLNAIPKLKRI
ncbi:MAG: hypothetical protein MK105_02445 [Crocinitomicaceae bacterium]|nr:hypothetical protein [Crocinitomicaceae bacterium]